MKNFLTKRLKNYNSVSLFCHYMDENREVVAILITTIQWTVININFNVYFYYS